MNDQAYTPMPTSPYRSGPAFGPIVLILLLVLGLGAIIFAVLTVKFYQEASTDTKALNAKTQAAAAAAKSSQKATDNHDAEIAAESPFRSYVAPDADGNFVINFPKDWSGWVDQEQSGTQVTLILNPNFVTRSNGDNNDPAAAVVTLQNQSGTQFMSQYSGAVQSGQLSQSTITVSGQPGYNLTGTFSDGSGTVREVVVPVRSNVLVFQNENSTYSEEFNEILAQAKIYP